MARALLQSGISISLSATTGAAATRISTSALTVHSVFAIPTNSVFFTALKVTDPCFQKHVATTVSIIDETSMLTAYTLNFVFYRLFCAVQHKHPEATWNTFLEYKQLILVGDHNQLPAVCHCKVAPATICKDSHFTRSVHWRCASRHHLTRSMRHASDPDYARFLDVIRERTVSQAVVDAVLQGCSITAEEAVCQACASIPVLTSHCDQANAYNLHIMQSLFASTMQLVQVGGTAPAQPALAEWFNCTSFHELPVIAIGCRVMSARNVSLGLGIANGTMGIANSFRMRSGAVCSTMVIFDGHTQPFPIKRSTTEKAWPTMRKCALFSTLDNAI